MLIKLLLFIFFTLKLFAHQTGLSYIEIYEDSQHHIDISYKKPLSDRRGEDITIHYPIECFEQNRTAQTIINGFIISKYSLWCGQKGLKDSRIWIDGLFSKDRGVMIFYKTGDANQTALLRASKPFIYLDTKKNSLHLFLEYIFLGVEHILSGYDHLLFVLALILLAKNRDLLLFSITGFTLAHSITLAFSILGIVTVSVAYIEAMIALSILFLARELMMEEESFTKKNLGIISFIFGLLHGFGFSNVLRTIGLPQDEIPLSLFAFNIGIELGQLLFIMIVSILLYIFSKFMSRYRSLLYQFLAYVIGVLSSYWLIERVMAF